MKTRLLAPLLAFFLSAQAGAIRPLVTDDADVVGGGRLQLETWFEFDRAGLEHNALFAVGATSWLELTTGFAHGAGLDNGARGYSLAGPVLQAKARLFEAVDNGTPGVALAVGGYPALGVGDLTPDGWGALAYLAVTQSMWGEAFVVHGNAGFAFGEAVGGTSALRTLVTFGVGVEVRIVESLQVVAETFRGDPYELDSGRWAGQAGLRYLFSEPVQFDGTAVITGSGVGGTLGVRLVSAELW